MIWKWFGRKRPNLRFCSAFAWKDWGKSRKWSQYSIWLQSGRPGFDPLQTQSIFPLSSVSRPALRSTQPPIQGVPCVLTPEVKPGRCVTLTTHPHIVPRSRMSRSHTSSRPWLLHGVAAHSYVLQTSHTMGHDGTYAKYPFHLILTAWQ
jgi:hypothetical protein